MRGGEKETSVCVISSRKNFHFAVKQMGKRFAWKLDFFFSKSFVIYWKQK